MNKYYQITTQDQTADINIYGDITSWPWLSSDVSAYSLKNEIDALDVDTINVHINSYGGEVAEGLAIHNALKNHKAKITTYCDGFACSIASVIFMAGDNRVMNDASLLMIHNAWSRCTGNADEMRKAADDLDKISEASKTIYLNHINIDADKLNELMAAESWISPTEALEMGFATEICATGDGDKQSQSARHKVMSTLLGSRTAEHHEVTVIEEASPVDPVNEPINEPIEEVEERPADAWSNFFGGKQNEI